MNQAQSTLTVQIADCSCKKLSNFFLILAVETGTCGGTRRTVRTEVVRQTQTPHFEKNNWDFKFPLSAFVSPLEGSGSRLPRITVACNEATKNVNIKGPPIVTPYGRLKFPMQPILDDLIEGKKSVHKLTLNSFSEERVVVGEVTLCISLNDVLNEEEEKKENLNVLSNFTVNFYAAVNLPLINDQLPSPFAIAKTTAAKRDRKQAKTVLKTINQSRNVLWRMPLSIEVSEKECREEGLFLAVVDSTSKSYLCRNIMPLKKFQTGVTYYAGLIVNDHCCYTLISVKKEIPHNDLVSYFLRSPNMFRAQLRLFGLLGPLPQGPRALFTCIRKIPSPAHKFLDESHKEPHLPFRSLYLIDADQINQNFASETQVSYITEVSNNPRFFPDQIFEFNITDSELNGSGGFLLEVFECDFAKITCDTERKQKHINFFGWAFLPFTLCKEKDRNCAQQNEIPFNFFSQPTDDSALFKLDSQLWESSSFAEHLCSVKYKNSPMSIPMSSTHLRRLSHSNNQSKALNELTTLSTLPTLYGSPSKTNSYISLSSLPPTPTPASDNTPNNNNNKNNNNNNVDNIDSPEEGINIPSSKRTKRHLRVNVNFPNPHTPNILSPTPPGTSAQLHHFFSPISPSSYSFMSPSSTPPNPSMMFSSIHHSEDADSLNPILNNDYEHQQYKIRLLEKDIFSLKEQSIQMRNQNSELVSKLNEMKILEERQRFQEQQRQQHRSEKNKEIVDLEQKITLLSEQLENEKIEKKKLQSQFEDSEIKMLRHEEMKKKFREVQNSYNEQCKFINEIQKENMKIKNTTKTQEQVIRRIERLLKKALHDSKESEENLYKARSERIKLEGIIVQLRKQLKSLGVNISTPNVIPQSSISHFKSGQSYESTSRSASYSAPPSLPVIFRNRIGSAPVKPVHIPDVGAVAHSRPGVHYVRYGPCSSPLLDRYNNDA